VFGGIRGLAIFLGVRATTLDSLHALHRRIMQFEPGSRLVMFLIQTGVATVALGVAWGLPWGLGALLLAAGAGVYSLRARPAAAATAEQSAASV
jgi:hypothetical protein